MSSERRQKQHSSWDKMCTLIIYMILRSQALTLQEKLSSLWHFLLTLLSLLTQVICQLKDGKKQHSSWDKICTSIIYMILHSHSLNSARKTEQPLTFLLTLLPVMIHRWPCEIEMPAVHSRSLTAGYFHSNILILFTQFIKEMKATEPSVWYCECSPGQRQGRHWVLQFQTFQDSFTYDFSWQTTCQ